MTLELYRHAQHQKLQQQLHAFWEAQSESIASIDPATFDFAKTEIPITRIRRIMRIEDDANAQLGYKRFSVSIDATVMVAKLCELFILDLSTRGWSYAADSNRKTLRRGDLVMATTRDEMLHFLTDVLHRSPEGGLLNIASKPNALD